MGDRRLVGIDLGITSAHTVRVLDGDGTIVCRRKAVATVERLAEVERAALAGVPPGTCLEVVLEPTGPCWPPIAVFFASRGHTVYRASSGLVRMICAGCCRGRPSPTASTPPPWRGQALVDPAGLHLLQLPSAERATLDRRVRACDRLTRQAAQHKRRSKDLVRQLLPTSPLTGDLGMADLAVLEGTGADPHALLACGPSRLGRLIATAWHGQQGTQRVAQWLQAARASLELDDDDPAVAVTDLAAEVQTEVRLLRATQAELDRHAAQREDCSFTGLAPRASETGSTDRKGQPIGKAGNRLLRTTVVRAADTARRQDPQLARLYYVQMVQRGKDHLGAVCVVAAHLAECAWTVMDRGMP